MTLTKAINDYLSSNVARDLGAQQEQVHSNQDPGKADTQNANIQNANTQNAI